MSITSRITRPWLSWLGLAALVIGGVALIAGVIYPMFGRAGQEAIIAGLSAPHEGDVATVETGAASRVMAKEASSSIIGTAWAASPQRMMIYTADVSLETKSVEKSHREIAYITRKAGGVVTGSGIQSFDGRLKADVTVRVPHTEYTATLDAICKLGKVLSRSEKGEDVTEEFVDLQSRVRNLKREEEAFLKVLERAVRIADILAVERELSRVRGEIETAEGRIKFLQNRIELSTITVGLYEPQPAVVTLVKWDVWNTGKAAANSLSGVFRGITSAIIWLVVFIPFWAVLGVVVYGVKRRYRRAG